MLVFIIIINVLRYKNKIYVSSKLDSRTILQTILVIIVSLRLLYLSKEGDVALIVVRWWLSPPRHYVGPGATTHATYKAIIVIVIAHSENSLKWKHVAGSVTLKLERIYL